MARTGPHYRRGMSCGQLVSQHPLQRVRRLDDVSRGVDAELQDVRLVCEFHPLPAGVDRQSSEPKASRPQ